jgi:hypothetical protein
MLTWRTEYNPAMPRRAMISFALFRALARISHFRWFALLTPGYYLSAPVGAQLRNAE